MEYITEGSEATIYKTTINGLSVIVKEFNCIREDSQYSTERAISDQKVSASLGYSPKVIDHYIEDEVQFIIMSDLTTKYVTLWDFYLTNDRELVKSVLRRTRKMTKELHKLDVVHGDLHGDNIMVSTDGRDIQLIDFAGALTLPKSADKPETMSDLDTARKDMK